MRRSAWPLLTTFCFEQGALAGEKLAAVLAEGPGFPGARVVASSAPTIAPCAWTPTVLANCPALTRLRLARGRDEHFSFLTMPRLKLEYLAWSTRREWPPVERLHEFSGWPGFCGGSSRAHEQGEWQNCLYNEAAVPLEPCLAGSILPDGSGLAPGEYPLVVSWRMWFGPGALRHHPRDRLLSFLEAWYVDDLVEGTVFVQMDHRLEDSLEGSDRRYAFRRWVRLDDVTQSVRPKW